MNNLARPRRAPDVSWREIGQEVVVVPIRTSVEQPLAVHALNPVGSFIWLLLDGALREDQLVDRVVEAFEVERAVALTDVREFLQELRAEGLLEDTA